MRKELYNIDTNEIISSARRVFLLISSVEYNKTPIRLANSMVSLIVNTGNLKALLTYTPLTTDIENIIGVSCDTVLEYSPQQNIQDIDSIKDIIWKIFVFMI